MPQNGLQIRPKCEHIIYYVLPTNLPHSVHKLQYVLASFDIFSTKKIVSIYLERGKGASTNWGMGNLSQIYSVLCCKINDKFTNNVHKIEP